MHTLSAHAWDYLPALKTVFESVGLDYLYHVNDFITIQIIYYPSSGGHVSKHYDLVKQTTTYTSAYNASCANVMEVQYYFIIL